MQNYTKNWGMVLSSKPPIRKPTMTIDEFRVLVMQFISARNLVRKFTRFRSGQLGLIPNEDQTRVPARLEFQSEVHL